MAFAVAKVGHVPGKKQSGSTACCMENHGKIVEFICNW
jgi:hypothetical protein